MGKYADFLSGDIRLTENFMLSEFVKSQTAKRKEINNSIDNPLILARLYTLCTLIIQPARTALGSITISSGYRSQLLNNAVGGSFNSQHVLGYAADLEANGVSNLQLAQWIAEHCEFDQLILECWDPEDDDPNSGWVHVSYVSKSFNRNTIKVFDGKSYKTIDKQTLLKL